MFVDSDDMLCAGAIEALMSAASRHDSDIVAGGSYCLQNNVKIPYITFKKSEIISNPHGILPGFAWGKVIKSTCFEKYCFPEGYWFEDSIMSFLIHPGKKNIFVLDSFVYLYRINPNGITSTCKSKNKAVDTYWITEMLMDYTMNTDYASDPIFFAKYLRQIHLNQQRMALFPDNIQESAFVLSCEMMTKYFDEKLIRSQESNTLVKSLLGKDFGFFKLYCACH